MRISELDDIEKEVLLGKVIERARADLNEGRPLTEMRADDDVFECDACGQTAPRDEARTGIPSAGVEGTFCCACRGEK